MSTYAWKITADFITENAEKGRVGVVGPRDLTDTQRAALDAGEGALFRLLDADGECIYLGRYLGDTEDEDAFGPLDDFGRPDAGCTEIAYQCHGWRPL